MFRSAISKALFSTKVPRRPIPTTIAVPIVEAVKPLSNSAIRDLKIVFRNSIRYGTVNECLTYFKDIPSDTLDYENICNLMIIKLVKVRSMEQAEYLVKKMKANNLVPSLAVHRTMTTEYILSKKIMMAYEAFKNIRVEDYDVGLELRNNEIILEMVKINPRLALKLLGEMVNRKVPPPTKLLVEFATREKLFRRSLVDIYDNMPEYNMGEEVLAALYSTNSRYSDNHFLLVKYLQTNGNIGNFGPLIVKGMLRRRHFGDLKEFLRFLVTQKVLDLSTIQVLLKYSLETNNINDCVAIHSKVLEMGLQLDDSYMTEWIRVLIVAGRESESITELTKWNIDDTDLTSIFCLLNQEEKALEIANKASDKSKATLRVLEYFLTKGRSDAALSLINGDALKEDKRAYKKLYRYYLDIKQPGLFPFPIYTTSKVDWSGYLSNFTNDKGYLFRGTKEAKYIQEVPLKTGNPIRKYPLYELLDGFQNLVPWQSQIFLLDIIWQYHRFRNEKEHVQIAILAKEALHT